MWSVFTYSFTSWPLHLWASLACSMRRIIVVRYVYFDPDAIKTFLLIKMQEKSFFFWSAGEGTWVL